MYICMYVRAYLCASIHASIRPYRHAFVHTPMVACMYTYMRAHVRATLYVRSLYIAAYIFGRFRARFAQIDQQMAASKRTIKQIINFVKVDLNLVDSGSHLGGIGQIPPPNLAGTLANSAGSRREHLGRQRSDYVQHLI